MLEKADPLCMKIELEVPVVLFDEFDHIVSYMYGNEIYIGESHLIYLYVLVTKLKLNGGLEGVLYHKIKKNCDKYHCVPYLLQAEELKALELVWLCSDAILQNLSAISESEWVSIPYTAFNLLVYRAKGGIDKYSVSIVSDVIVQYLKAKMSKKPSEAKQIVQMIDAEDISTVALEYALPIIKICDVLFAEKSQKWRYEHITLYELSMNKISFEFTSFHKELCQQLQGLSPITFSDLLIRADHLKEHALNQAWEHYKAGNHAAYFNDKRLQIVYILEQRKERKLKRKQRLSPISNECEYDIDVTEELNEENIPSIPSDDDEMITLTFEDDDNEEMKLNETIVANIGKPKEADLILYKTPTKKGKDHDDVSITSATPSSSNVIDTILEFENNSSVNTFRRSQRSASVSPQYPMSHRFDYSLNSHRCDYSPRPRSVSIDVMNNDENESQNVPPYICESENNPTPLKQRRNNLILQSLTGNMADLNPFTDECEHESEIDYDKALHFKLIDVETPKL